MFTCLPVDPMYYRPESVTGVWQEQPRRIFIDALDFAAPQVAEKLEKDIWPLYKALKPLREYVLSWPSLLAACKVPQLHPELQPLQDGIEAWARAVKLDESVWEVDPQWILDVALHSLCEFETPVILSKELHLWARFNDLIPFYIGGTESEHVQFEVKRWDPNFSSLTAYAKDTRESLLEQLETYLKHIEAEARARGWSPAPRKNRFVAYTWLIHHHVLGRSYADITETWVASGGTAFDEAHVRTASRRVAKAIGMRLPLAERGRPRGRR